MNFLAFCERVAEEKNGRPIVFSSVDLGKSDGEFIITEPFQRQVIRAVQSAHDSIVNFSKHWTFLQKRGALWTLTPNVREYRKPYIGALDWDSLYLTLSGSDSRWPIYQEEYDSWQERERSGIDTPSIPISLVMAPQDKWIFYPTPSQAYVLNGDLQYTQPQLLSSTDEPLWDERFDDVLVWAAVAHLEGRAKSKEEIVQGLNIKSNIGAFQAIWVDFLNEYLPKPRGIC
jgi:hypothetical protein